MIHQGKDQGDIPTLVGQPLEAAEVWDRLIKSVGIKIKLRASHSPPMAPRPPPSQSRKALRQKLGKQEYWPQALLSTNSVALMNFQEPQSRGTAGQSGFSPLLARNPFTSAPSC